VQLADGRKVTVANAESTQPPQIGERAISRRRHEKGRDGGDGRKAVGAERLRDGGDGRKGGRRGKASETRRRTQGRSARKGLRDGAECNAMSVSASVSSPFIRRPIATSLLGVAVMLGGTLGYRGFRSRRCASAPRNTTDVA